MTLELPSPELLEYATEDELDAIIDYLAAAAGVSDSTRGEWTLQPRQQRAEDLLSNLEPQMSHELLYGGAVGGGKTDWMLWHAYHLCLKYRNFHALYIRRTFPMLRRTVVLRSLERFDRKFCRYLTSENAWKFENGSLLEFGHMEVDNNVFDYLSAEYDLILHDELTQFPNDMPYLYLMSRLRSSLDKTVRGYVPHVVASTNPGGVGGAWVKGRFIDPMQPEERLVLPNENGTKSSRVFVPARLDDNRYIDAPTYRASLGHLKEDTRKALEEGSWDVVEGQYFSEWSRSLHVIDPFPIPAWWQKIRGIDYGFTNPWCCLWAAFDGDETAYIYREAYATGLTPPQQCQRILSVQDAGEKIKATIIDPSTWARTGAGVPIAQQYADNGISCVRGLNDRLSGWARVREYLRPVPIEGQEQPYVRLRIFSTCTNLIRTLPLLVHDDKRPEDLDTRGEDHAVDAARYLLMSRPYRPLKQPVQPKTAEEEIARRLSMSARQRNLDRDGKLIDHPTLGWI